MREDGFVRVKDLLQIPHMKLLLASEKDIRDIVWHDSNQRFQTREEHLHLYMRATQGHSIRSVQDNACLQDISVDDDELPWYGHHGTLLRHVKDSLAEGLTPGGKHQRYHRNQIHFTANLSKNLDSPQGLSSSYEIILTINIPLALNEGNTSKAI